MKKILIFLMILCLLFSTANAATTYTFDYTNNQSSYGRQISTLIKASQTVKTRLLSAASTDYTAWTTVLCRTDGTDVDFTPLNPLYIILGPDHRATLIFGNPSAADKAIATLSANPAILYAEPDAVITACETETPATPGDLAPIATPTDLDPISFTSWGAERMGFESLLRYARRCGTGTCTVAIIDSGVYRHPALTSKMRNYGWDYVDNDKDPTNDGHGHGTHVAGIVADCTQGVPVYLYPIRVLNNSGAGSISNAAAAVYEAADAGIDIINMSVSTQAAASALDEAILYALEKGCTVTVAAGNYNCDTGGTAPIYPAHLTNTGVIVVGSANSDGSRAGYSCYGTSVDLYAYGTGISSTDTGGGYKSRSGTSQATPHISAACALLKLLYGYSPATLENRLVGIAGPVAVNIPHVADLAPSSYGFRLKAVTLAPEEALQLPTQALPFTSGESITYTVSDATVFSVNDTGILSVSDVGTGTVTASCRGLDDTAFTVTVEADARGSELHWPAALSAIHEEAFRGNEAIDRVLLPATFTDLGPAAFADCTNLRFISLPDSLTEIGTDLLNGSPKAVILCSYHSPAATYAEQSTFQYILH